MEPLCESLPYHGGEVCVSKGTQGFVVRGLLPLGRVSHGKLILGEGLDKN